MINLYQFLKALILSSSTITLLALGLSRSSDAQRAANGFICDRSRENPVLMAVRDGQRIELITFVSNWAAPPFDDLGVRCNQVAANFNTAFINGGVEALNSLTFGHVNNHPVLCIPNSPQDLQNNTCRSDTVLITFQNEWQGCSFVPALIQLLTQQDIYTGYMASDFENMQEQCEQQFPRNRIAGQSTEEERNAFRGLNP